MAIVTLKFPNFSRSNGFLLGQRLAQCRFIHRIMRYARKISTMIGVEEQGTAINLAWAVLTRATAGRSEVVKITSHEEADDFVRRNPDMFYKSGPFVVG